MNARVIGVDIQGVEVDVGEVHLARHGGPRDGSTIARAVGCLSRVRRALFDSIGTRSSPFFRGGSGVGRASPDLRFSRAQR